MSIDDVIALYQDYHWPDELRLLNKLAAGITSGVIVAIGSYRGQSDCALALDAQVPVYCIDPRDAPGTHYGDVDRPYWMQNVLAMGVAEKVRPINLPSLAVEEMWRPLQDVSLLFVDGNHDEVADDLNAWMPHVVNGGLICFHDNNFASVVQAATSRTDMVELERSDRTTVYRKEPLYEPYTYDDLTLLVRKGPYFKDDCYISSEVRTYDIGTEPIHNFIDVGAHIGWFSARIASLYPDAEGVAVEPEPSAAALLRMNVEPFGVRVLEAHVNYIDNLVLEVDPINAGSHMMLPRGTQPQPGKTIIEPPYAESLEWIMAWQRWDALSLLKVDCETCENDVLINCSDDILRRVSRIVGEFHLGPQQFEATIGARLRLLGFEVTATQDPLAHATFVAVNKTWDSIADMINKDTGKVIGWLMKQKDTDEPTISH